MKSDILLIGYDEGTEEDITVLTTGRRNSDGSITILNSYIGNEAEELYSKLTRYNESINLSNPNVIPACLLSIIRKEE